MFEIDSELLPNFANDTENPELNLNLAEYYYANKQYAAALSFYLRAAERTENKDIQYYCIIKGGRCLEIPGNRRHTVKTMYCQALSLIPTRPEAYYFLSRANEWSQDWINCYSFADLGLQVADCNTQHNMTVDEYPGIQGLIFQKAISAWWWGKCEEARQLHNLILKEYFSKIDDGHLNAIIGNMRIMYPR
jgi:hypothetical protein